MLLTETGNITETGNKSQTDPKPRRMYKNYCKNKKHQILQKQKASDRDTGGRKNDAEK